MIHPLVVVTSKCVFFSLSEVAGVDYQQVTTSGHFDADREVLIGPRSFIDGRGEQGGGGIISARDSKVGFLVVAPFTLTTGERILINRLVTVKYRNPNSPKFLN